MKSMKSTKKLALIASAMVLSFGFSMAGVVSANATDGDATGTNYFVFHDGAAVRLVDDEVGEAIRFQATIGKDYYEALGENADYAGKTITLKSKVSDNDNAARYLATEWVLYGENAITMTYKNNEANFYHSIQFEQLFQEADADDIKEACALDLKGEMWIEVTDGETSVATLNGLDASKEYTVTSVTRSAREIANEAYDTYADESSDKYDTAKAARVAKYFGARTEVTKDIYFEAGETLNVVLAKGVADDFNFTGAEVYGYKDTVAGQLPTAETFAETLGSKAAVSFTMFDADNNVINVNAENAMYVTKALKTEADLKVFDIVDDDDKRTTQAATVIDGYYVLANNIENDVAVGANQHLGMAHNKEDMTSSTYKPNWMGASTGAVGFAGTFDGQGYTMAFDVYQAGLFGVLQPGAIIQNVGMDVSFTNTQNTMSVIIAMQAPRSTNSASQVTIQNVYVNVDDFRTANNSTSTAMFAYGGQYIQLEYVVMNIGAVVLNENTIASGAIYMQDIAHGTNTSRFKTVFVISPTPIWLSMDENTTAANRNAKTISISDVNNHTNATDTDPNNNGTLKYDIGGVAAGTLLTERNAGAMGSIHCQLEIFRHNSVEALQTALEDGSIVNAAWRLGQFKTENGWDTSSGVPVWATFAELKNA